MAKIEHPMMRAARTAKQDQIFVKTVEPPTDKLRELVNTAAQIEEQPWVAPPLDPFNDEIMKGEIEKKKTLEKLVFFKKPVIKNVTIDGTVFTLKILNSKDSKEVFKTLAATTDEEQQAVFNLLMLAASLVEVNGIPLESAYTGPEEISSSILKRYNEISEWPAPLTNALTKEYREFIETEDKKYSADFLGK